MLIATPSSRWWGRFFGAFGHVDALIRSGGKWVYYAPSLDMTHVQVLDDWRDAVAEGATVVRFRVLRKARRYRCPQVFAPFTCVEQIKALLGVRAPWVLTPKQLIAVVRNG